MSLEPIGNLLKYRKKLLKRINYPVPLMLEKEEQEIWRMGTEAQRRALEALDAEIRERTGGLVDPSLSDSEN